MHSRKQIGLPTPPLLSAVSARLAIAVCLALWAAPAALAEPPPEGDWTFSIAPYIWLPAMTGKATVAGHTVDVDTSIADLFTESDFVFGLLVETEAWYKKRWGLAFNGEWGVLKKDDITVGPSGCPPPADPCIFPATFDLQMNVGLFEFLGFWDPGEWQLGSDEASPSLFVQPLVGARVTVMRVEFDVSGGTDLGQTKTWVDPILGARFGVRFGPDRRWSWLMRGDFGGFGAGSEFTWNVVGMLAYDFHIRSVASSIAIGVRALSQDYKDGSGAKAFRWDVTQYGPLIAWNFYF